MMRFAKPLLEGRLIRRHKRFSAQIKLSNGEEVMAHCANPGSILGYSEPGSRVLLSEQDNPHSHFKYQLEIIYAGRTPVGIHTGRGVSVLSDAIAQGQIKELVGYATLERVHQVPKETPVDLILRGNGLRSCSIAVRAVTLVREGVAYYPDAVMTNGVQQLNYLTNLVREGRRAMLFLAVHRADAQWFRPADHIDHPFAQAFRDTLARGVECLCYRAKVTRQGIELAKQLEVDVGLS